MSKDEERSTEESRPSEREKRQRQRFARQLPHEAVREAAQRRKHELRARRHTKQKPRPARQWREDDGDSRDERGDETFEKITRRRTPAKHPTTGDVADLADLPRAIVAAVHHGRVDLDVGRDAGHDHRVSARVAARLVLDPEFRLAVGDEVAFRTTEGPPRIEALLPRRSSLTRPDPGNPHRDLVLAANVDLAVITVACAEPPPRPGLIDRFLLALAHGGVQPTLCVTKADLVADLAQIDSLTRPYVDLHVPVFACSATRGDGLAALRAHLARQTCVFVGHSGVGKSSLLNALDPGGERAIGAVRDHDGKGRHTTAWSSLRRLADGTAVIDTPGIRSLGLARLEPGELLAGFPEFRTAGRCRFADCDHRHAPDCAVRDAVAAGRIPAARFASYLRILASSE